MSDAPQPDRWDNALRARLGKLREQRVDTSDLERRLESALAEETKVGDIRESPPFRARSRSGWRRVTSVAAVLALGAGLVWGLLSVTAQAPRLSPKELASAHRHYLEGDARAVLVDSVGEANIRLAAIWAEAPVLPDVELGTIEACCVHQMKHCRAACLHLRYEGQPVTVAVTHLHDARPPDGKPIGQAGRRMTVASQGEWQMVSFVESDRCVCVIGRQSTQSLTRLAMSLKFDHERG